MRYHIAFYGNKREADTHGTSSVYTFIKTFAHLLGIDIPSKMGHIFFQMRAQAINAFLETPAFGDFKQRAT